MDKIIGRLRQQLSDEIHSEAKDCKVYSRSEGIKRCARCKAVVYYRIKHQNAD
jgi:hypothetical protein